MLEHLKDHQDKILSIMAGVEKLLVSGSIADARTLSAMRWELTRAMTAYQHFKHREIFQPLIDRGTSQQAWAARALMNNCIKAGNECRAHVAKWSGDGISDWDDYRRAALTFIARVRRYMATEAREVAGLASAETNQVVANRPPVPAGLKAMTP